MDKTAIALVGLGPIGQQIARYASARKSIEIVAAMDPASGKAGKKLSEICSDLPEYVPVEKSLASALEGSGAEVAVVATVSELEKLSGQIKEIAPYGLPVVSTCEELTYPWHRRPDLAKEIDEICKREEIACMGTGVNPGFLMDYLPSVLTSVCQSVEKITVKRIQDATGRRIPFRDKIGAGLSAGEFERKRDLLSHVGLPESSHMIADALGWKLDRVEETLGPVISGRDYPEAGVAEGEVCGIEQVVKAYNKQGEECITLIFYAAVGQEDPYDAVHIAGTPGFESVIRGGINGDIATAAILVNTIMAVKRLKPGLRTMLDIPVASNFR